MKIGFIGTGNMGGPMALHLVGAGHELRVHDLRPDATRELERAGARRVDSARAAAEGALVVFLSLPRPADVERATLGDEGVFGGCSPGAVVVDMTTNSPTLVRRLAKEARARGLEFLDAPVSGGVRGARDATLAVMVGGDPQVFERCRPLLEKIGRNVFRVGDVGAGNVAKLVNNMLAFVNMMGAAEALVLGAKAGVDPSLLWKVVKASSGNSLSWEFAMPAILKDRLPRAFPVALACKDVGLATALGRELGVPLAMGGAAEALLEGYLASGLGDEDVLATIRTLEQQAGVVVRGTWKE